MKLFEENMELMKHECESGLKKECTLPIYDLCISLTNYCNLYCIMCPYCSKNYENRTYNNEIPYFTTFEEYKKILSHSNVEKLVCGGGNYLFKEKINIHYTHGESLLNKEIVAWPNILNI